MLAHIHCDSPCSLTAQAPKLEKLEHWRPCTAFWEVQGCQQAGKYIHPTVEESAANRER